jgi:hypothetical protein
LLASGARIGQYEVVTHGLERGRKVLEDGRELIGLKNPSARCVGVLLAAAAVACAAPAYRASSIDPSVALRAE